jgi:hypothetical protein
MGVAEQYVTTAFVRNHYRRMVSWAVHLHVMKGEFEHARNVKAMQDRILMLIDVTNSFRISRPDSLYYRWTCGTDNVLRMEDGDLFEQLRGVGWDLVPPPANLHVAHNIYRPWHEYYDAEFVKHFEPYHDEMRLYHYAVDEWDQ